MSDFFVIGISVVIDWLDVVFVDNREYWESFVEVFFFFLFFDVEVFRVYFILLEFYLLYEFKFFLILIGLFGKFIVGLEKVVLRVLGKYYRFFYLLDCFK